MSIPENTQEWIPVVNHASDPMPKEGGIYLCTYKTPKGRYYVRDIQCTYSGESPKWIGWSKKINGTVIAWKPLPEPFKG